MRPQSVATAAYKCRVMESNLPPRRVGAKSQYMVPQKLGQAGSGQDLHLGAIQGAECDTKRGKVWWENPK